MTIVDINDTQISVPNAGNLSAINITNSAQPLLDIMQWENDQDEVAVGFAFVIPSDAVPGQREMRIRYAATLAN